MRKENHEISNLGNRKESKLGRGGCNEICVYNIFLVECAISKSNKHPATLMYDWTFLSQCLVFF